MDSFFNDRYARRVTEIISKLDDDEAEMFMRFATYDVLMADIAANRRSIDSHVEEVHKRLRNQVGRSLVSLVSKNAATDTREIAALVGVVSKKKNGDSWGTAYEELYHQPQPRDKGGRWSLSVSHEKAPKQPKGGVRHVIVGAEPGFDLSRALAQGGKKTNAFAEEWHKQHPLYASTHQRTYDRIAAGAKALEGTGNAKIEAASQVGQFLGSYGPQAEKVVGPHLRRTAYRYRGTERTPDQGLVGANGMRNQQIRNILRNDGLTEADIDTPMRVEGSQRASIQYLMGRLPKKKFTKLQAASGKIPPSEGIIINGDGKIITQAVGYMDDHYLPFNLKNLKGLQGGHYVRTRSQGGLTTEDIYTGLVAGARSVTVVSRSGVFTMNFEDDFRGGRRYNDKAAGMIGRYAKTLDAVKSKQVEREPLSLEEKADIREEVEREYADDPDMPRADLEDLIKEREQDYRTRPSLTKAELADIDARARKDNEGDEHKYRLARSELISAAMESKTQRAYQLDGEGYSVAMEALREQFPYYIANVQYQTKREAGYDNPFTSETDVGYVKPRYIRPEGAMEGYFDTTIAGGTGHKVGGKETGKVSAAHTNYANWAYNPERARSLKRVENEEEGTESGAPVSNKQKVKEAIERGKREVTGKKSLSDAVDLWSATLPAEELKNVKTLQRAAADFDAVWNDPAERTKLVEDLDKVGKKAANNDDFTDEYAQHQKLMKAYRAIGSGSKWDAAKAGDKPDIPFEFDIEGGKRVGYSPAANDVEVEHEWARVAPKVGNPAINSMTDDELKKRASAYGQAAASLGKGDIEDIAQQLAAAEMPQADITRAVRSVEREDTDRLAKDFAKRSEAFHRLRRLQHNHSGASGAPQIASSAAPSTPAPKEVGNTRSSKTVADLTGAVTEFSGLASHQGVAGGSPTVSAAYKHLGLDLAKVNRGEMRMADFKTRARDLFAGGSLTQNQVDHLTQHLEKFGIDIESED